jgi:putative transposase
LFGGKGAVMNRDTGRCDEEDQAGADRGKLAAAEMVRRAREQGLSLIGPDGLLKQLTKTVLETALSQEMTEHLGHDKNGMPDPATGNVRNGTRARWAASAMRCSRESKLEDQDTSPVVWLALAVSQHEGG